MTIAFVQQAGGGGPQFTAAALTGETATFGSNVTAGNAIVVIVRAGNAGPDPGTVTVTDSLSNTYALATSYQTNDPSMWAFVAQNISGGTCTITLHDTNGSSWYNSFWAGEYSGVATSSAVDTGATGAVFAAAGPTDLVSSSITTAGSGEAIILAASQAQFLTYTQGTDFTIRSGNVNNDLLLGVEDYITTTSLSSYVGHITSNGTNQSTVVWVALKPPGGGGGGRGLFRPPNLVTGAGGSFFSNPLN